MTGRQHPMPATPRADVDAGTLRRHAFGPLSVGWWGTVAFIVIEGTSLVICLLCWLYLRRNFDSYPPAGFAPPGLTVVTINSLVILATIPVALRVDAAAHAMDRRRTLRLLCILLIGELAVIILRGFELASLNVRWDSNAYGSAVWFTLGLHTLLLLVDFGESLVFAAILALGRAEARHFTDVSDDVFYWYFIAGSALVINLVIFVGPRVL